MSKSDSWKANTHITTSSDTDELRINVIHHGKHLRWGSLDVSSDNKHQAYREPTNRIETGTLYVISDNSYKLIRSCQPIHTSHEFDAPA